MTLTAEQIAARKGRLTASRIACLMQGDAKAIMRLWEEMTNGALPEDLSGVWPVRLGEATEQLQLDWYEQQTGAPVSRRGEVVVHQDHDWACCTLDGWLDAPIYCPIEVKHVGGREPLEVIVDRYQPQMHWQMFITDAQQCCLSVIMGASEPIVEFIPRFQPYVDEMLRRGAQFMQFVRTRTPPVALDAVPPPVDASKVYDMSESNSWAEGAYMWLQTREAADRCKLAEKMLKSAVPDDAKKCTGHGVRITRDRAGRLSLREDT